MLSPRSGSKPNLDFSLKNRLMKFLKNIGFLFINWMCFNWFIFRFKRTYLAMIITDKIIENMIALRIILIYIEFKSKLIMKKRGIVNVSPHDRKNLLSFSSQIPFYFSVSGIHFEMILQSCHFLLSSMKVTLNFNSLGPLLYLPPIFFSVCALISCLKL